MAGKRKKRKSRWDYLNDFSADAEGRYSYRGNIRRYEGPVPYEKERARLTALTAVMAAVTAAAGFLPAPSMVGFGNFYVVPLFILELIGVMLTAWAAVKMIAGGSELRSYVYDKSVKKIPHRADFTSIAAALCIPANIVYLCINGTEGKLLFTVLLMAAHAVIALSAQLLKRTVAAEAWNEMQNPHAAAEFEAAFEGEEE